MTAKTPFTVLAEYASRSRQSAKGLPAQANVKRYWSGVGFSLLGQRMVAPLGEVVEILKVPDYTRMPAVQPWVLGVSNVRGRLLPLFDLKAFFGGQATQNRSRRRVMVLEMGELYSGLIVDEVFGMQHFPVDQFTESVPQVMQEFKHYTAGSYVQMDVNWVVFSPYLLARDPRFFNAAAA